MKEWLEFFLAIGQGAMNLCLWFALWVFTTALAFKIIDGAGIDSHTFERVLLCVAIAVFWGWFLGRRKISI